jgi:hypothetical protein
MKKYSFFLKNSFVVNKNALSLRAQNKKNGPVAQLDRASDYESEGLRFDSLRGHYKISTKIKV